MSIKVSLTIIEGLDSGETREFSDGVFTIGRNKTDLVLKDKKVSGKHCEVSIESGEVWVEDLNSTNGTFIGGKKLNEKQVLRNLDEIVLGHTKISIAIIDQIASFKKKQPSAPPPPPAPTEAAPDEVVESFEIDSMVSESSSEELVDLGDPIFENSQSTKVKREISTVELPPSDAVYRDTGIRRIEDLIQDEMSSFSKWDQPAMSENTGRSQGIIPKIKVQLIARKGPDGITNFVCTNTVSTMGRKDVDIRLNDLDCSRKHAAIEIIAGTKVFVRDLASTNGTYVNGKKIAYQEVRSGDLIQIGQTIFEVLIEG
ncbi:MAG: FHA domain-containing protein [Deltaproteobacteria bacterium]|nr:FHA domain-containing protein [Deltaproteobacteria bacterium]